MSKSFITINCMNCQKPFDKLLVDYKRTKKHFCSRACAASFNNKGVTHNKPKSRICKHCSKEFLRNYLHRDSIRCPECKKANKTLSDLCKNLTLTEYQQRMSVKGKHSSWTNAHVRILNRVWNKHLTNLPCKVCGYNKHVELCHIKAITAFPKTAKLSEINAENNNVQLCRNHHWELDNGFLNIANFD